MSLVPHVTHNFTHVSGREVPIYTEHGAYSYLVVPGFEPGPLDL
jgi:hypothetical protein